MSYCLTSTTLPSTGGRSACSRMSWRCFMTLLSGEKKPRPCQSYLFNMFVLRGLATTFAQGEILQAQLDYWQKKLSGALPALELPTDQPRLAVQTYNGSIFFFGAFQSTD